MAWCFAAAPAAEARSLDEILKSGVLRVGTYADQPPMSVLAASGKYEGFDVDIATKIAETMKVKLEIVPVQTAQRIPYLTSGRIDISMGALTRTPERALVVDYTIPLHSETVLVLTTEQVAAKSWKDLDDAKVTLAQGRSTWTADLVKGQLPKAQALLLDGPSEQVRAVSQGRAAAIVDILDTFMAFTKNYPDVKWRVIEAPIYSAWCGIGVPKGADGLRNFLNVVLYDMHAKGVVQEVWTRWYGAPNPMPVPLNPVF